ncbi:PREDICTED: cyclin-SDS-like [Camelina sativa]|uniref:Cyclin-SDS-like n=1 Tax=Camelina sativa TaxID=90675 RepID=A0ABM0VNV5_CAMSA|nr:PREDICTED: cyclin-SDS-like [Camelina sativa]
MKEIASKRKAEPTPFPGKKLLSTRLRRKRAQISPVVVQSPLWSKQIGVSAASVDSCSDFLFVADDNVSCGSSRVEKTRIEEIEVSKPVRDAVKETVGDSKFRRITRSYAKLHKEKEADEIEVSESSCVDSSSGAGLRRLKVKGNVGVEINENDEISYSRSDVTFAEHVSNSRNLSFGSENKESDVVSFISGVEYCSKLGSVTGGADDNEEIEISKPISFVEADSSLVSAKESKPELEIVGCVSDLACSEKFSDEEVSDSLDEDESSEQRSEIYSQYSDFDCSDYTPSLYFDSGSEFSEKSSSDSPISHSRSLYLEFKEQFCRSTIPNELGSSCQEEFLSEVLRFDDEEVEESYQRLRERERSLAYMRDCAKAYCSRMNHTDIITRLRCIMVQWIVEQCSKMELQQETLFLGVGLLNRFLSKGLFKSERTLILVGIASLTLATRIEENQPYNSIRKGNFRIQNLKYSRHEVVAMEWLVQEVLNFKCFTPTIFNFLWFYLKAARANPEVERKAKSLAITSLSDHTQLCFWPSTVAAALVVLACIEHNKISAYQRVIKVHVRTTDNELPECVKSLDWLLGR